jgi:hypothetical protein
MYDFLIFCFRCYVQNLLTFDANNKNSQLLPCGWMDDIPSGEGDIEPKDENSGFKER